MGHRALVAYRRPDYLYDVRYSHWGGDDLALADAIAAETPLARGAVDAGLLAGSVALERLLTDYLDPRVHEALYLVPPSVCRADSGDDTESEGGTGSRGGTGARGDTGSGDDDGPEDVIDDPTVTPYRVLWLEWGEGRDGGRGAIVEVDPGPRDRALLAWFRGVKTTLADAVDMGVLSRRAARSYLEARLCEDAGGRVYTYSGSADGVAGTERSDPDHRPDRGFE